MTERVNFVGFMLCGIHFSMFGQRPFFVLVFKGKCAFDLKTKAHKKTERKSFFGLFFEAVFWGWS